MNTTIEENGIITIRNEDGEIVGGSNSGVCAPSLQIGINKHGSSISSSGASVTSCRMISGLDLPRGGVTGSLAKNPDTVLFINAVVDKKPVPRIGCDAHIPMMIPVSGETLHVIVNLGDDLGVGHKVDVELDISFANVEG